MFDKTDVFNVKKEIQQILGSKVRLETNKGRHKAVVSMGIVANCYPSIFTVLLTDETDSAGPPRKMSFSYTDVLTNTVEITLCE